MKAGRASRTAELVCMGRALAHEATPAERFSDPTALQLLPEEARARVERLRSGAAPSGLRGRIGRFYLETQSKMMVVRTLAIDDAVREAHAPQLVILGAGLDGRAWRMPELREVTVFEVDHPDSQREKRERIGSLSQTARELRFVAVDFTRDRLEDALAAAGHDPARPTTWIWEGVVMYLAPADVEATLAVLQRRSAAGSRLIVMYHAPAAILRLVNFIVSRLGEPLRSSYQPAQMRELLSRFGFGVVRDDDIPTLARALSPELIKPTRSLGHLRIATADRLPRLDQRGELGQG